MTTHTISEIDIPAEANPDIIFTQASSARDLALGAPQGFEVDSMPREWNTESFPGHLDLAKEMLIFYKKGEADGADAAIRKFGVAKGESPVWKELQPYRGSVRTNGETGSKQRRKRGQAYVPSEEAEPSEDGSRRGEDAVSVHGSSIVGDVPVTETHDTSAKALSLPEADIDLHLMGTPGADGTE